MRSLSRYVICQPYSSLSFAGWIWKERKSPKSLHTFHRALNQAAFLLPKEWRKLRKFVITTRVIFNMSHPVKRSCCIYSATTVFSALGYNEAESIPVGSSMEECNNDTKWMNLPVGISTFTLGKCLFSRLWAWHESLQCWFVLYLTYRIDYPFIKFICCFHGNSTTTCWLQKFKYSAALKEKEAAGGSSAFCKP